MLLTQGGSTAVKTRFEMLTPGQREIVADLDRIGMLCQSSRP